MTTDFIKELGLSLSVVSGKVDTEKLISYNPTTEEPISVIQECTEIEYKNSIVQSRERFQSWREVPAPLRGLIVREIGERLRTHKLALAKLISLEMGKNLQEAQGEVQEMIDMADFAVGLSRMLYGVTMPSERSEHKLYEQWHPLGIVAIITAFNFPVAVWAWNAFIAVVCGNTVVWKPSSKTPLCSMAVHKICIEVMKHHHLEGLFTLVISHQRTISDCLLHDTNIDLVSFTGSCQTGRYVNECVAKRMGRVILELGGNNAVIVDETAPLELAIPALVFGAIGTSGQRCTTTRRVFIQETLFDDVVNQLVQAYKQISIGDPLNEKNLMGPLIDKHAIEAYKRAIKACESQGAKIIYGARLMEGKGFFVEPTLIQASHEWDIVKQETFAPILYLVPYRFFEEAIAMQNAVEQGLSSSLFTQSLRHSEIFLSARGSDCGIANINVGTSGAEIGAAFGGEKQTGKGREAGSDAWKAYMRRQTNTINWGTALPLAQGITFSVRK